MQVIKVIDPSQYAYVFRPYLKPIARVIPGEKVVVETQDAYGGAITSLMTFPPSSFAFLMLTLKQDPFITLHFLA